jgi:hypothetical protein
MGALSCPGRSRFGFTETGGFFFVYARFILPLHCQGLPEAQTQALFAKSASVSFLNEHTWCLSSQQLGRFLHILAALGKEVSSKCVMFLLVCG